MDEQVRLDLTRGAQRQLLVGAVDWVAGLESHDLAPAELAKARPELRRRVAQVLEVVVHRRLDAAQATAHVDRVRDVVQVMHRRVLLVGCAEHARSFRGLVGRPDVADLERRYDHALEIPESDVVAGLDAGSELLADV